MNLEKLKAQQAALKIHSSLQEQLTVLVKTFGDGAPVLTAVIVQKFASLGLQASVRWGAYYLEGLPSADVVVPPETLSSVHIDVWHTLEFDQQRLRSVFDRSGQNLPPQTPMALPIEISVLGHGYNTVRTIIWWHGPSDNEQLTAKVVDMFKGKPDPGKAGSCFVATVIFGERSEEVAILRKWRDERLSESIVGRKFVKAYYELGPFCATAVQGNAVIRRLARTVLLAVCHWLSRRI